MDGATQERMFRNTVTCKGLAEGEITGAVVDLLSEFAERPWHQSVSCEWQGGVLRLTTQSEGDANGVALLDEFQDAVVAYINFSGTVRFEIEAVVAL
jgi:hypothetical protein